MIKRLLRWLSPSGPQARLSILIFHRVLPQPDPLFPGEVDAARFEEICGWLQGWFNVLPLDESVRRLKDGTLPERSLSITFDDGYADNHDVALPILQKHNLTATFFIATGFLDGGRMWNDTVIEAVRRTGAHSLDLCGVRGVDLGIHPVATVPDKQVAIGHILRNIKYLVAEQRQQLVEAIAARAQAELPGDLMMTSDQVRRMRAAGMQIGAHTVSHPILAGLDPASARREIETGKRTLEACTGESISLFAYPNGQPGKDYDDGAIALARECGFEAAVSTAWGAADGRSDPFQLPRFTPWDRSRLRFAARLGANLRKARV